MQNTSNVGSVGNDGLQNTQGQEPKNSPKRLRPFEIATLFLPGEGKASVSVIDATDEQFDMFIRAAGIRVEESEAGTQWTFDDRCRVINHARKYTIALPFVSPTNTNNSAQPIETIQLENKNNSDGELFESPERASEA